ncbi:hypothetical protein [Thioalkalivibrio sp. ALMg9]|nr:hypothetical protein [Thioalkalivibrio sp. ALMg9]
MEQRNHSILGDISLMDHGLYALTTDSGRLILCQGPAVFAYHALESF